MIYNLRVNKASSQPIRRTQPRPPLGRFVQSQISIWANQARPGPGLQVNEGGQQAPPLEVAPAQQTLAPPPHDWEGMEQELPAASDNPVEEVSDNPTGMGLQPPQQVIQQVIPQPVPILERQVDDQQLQGVAGDGVDEQEGLSLRERVRPHVPPAQANGPATQGWESIRRLGGWKAFLVECPMLEEVPEQHKGAWCTAWTESLRRWKEASSEHDKETALLWISFWAQGLQRKPSRGGRQGRVEVASRYNCVLEEDWAGLVDRWERDKHKRDEKYVRRSRPDRKSEELEQKELAKQRRIVIGLIEAGQLGKAMGRVTSHGLGDIRDQAVKDQLAQKFPPRQRPLPEIVSNIKPIDSFKNLRGSLLSLNPGTAAGSGGLRNEYLVALGEKMQDQEVNLLEEFGLAYTACELPGWFYAVWQTLQTVAPYKDSEQEAVRPLGLKNSLVKTFHKETMSQSKPEIREFLEPVQLGISVAGAALLTRSVSGVMHAFPDFICFRLDLKNAFNEMCRRAVLDILENEESLKHLVTFAAAILSPVAALESGGKVWGETAEGMGQGDPPSGDFFAVGLHPDLLELDRACSEGGGQARAGHDDVFAQGPAEVVIPAVVRFAQAIWERCHLQLQWGKSHIFSWSGTLPEGSPAGVELAGKVVDGVFEVGFDCYGVPMGTDKYVSSELMVIADVIVRDAKKTRELLASNKQALWSTLRLSTAQRFQYHCQHVHPTLCEPVAEWIDKQLWKELEETVGFDIPQGDRGQEGDVAITVPINGLSGMSFQSWAVRQPVKLHGWGFRSLRETCAPAYLGTLETSIPRMQIISPIMVNTWGGAESWGTGATASRWSTVLSSGCREGDEMRRAWEILTSEAREAAGWLGAEVEHVFTVPLAGLGEGSVTGKTRGEVVSAREKTRALLLTKALAQYMPRKARPAWAWKQRDKISSSWLLALPGADSSLSNAEFAEAAATSLCLPSPACMGRVGETVKGRKVVDMYGDQVQAAPLPGDHWRQRHDQIKHVLHRLCMWAGLPCELEVFNIFSRHIPQAGLSRIDKNRDRQGMVPDMRITLTTGGVSRQVLHEIKCMSSSQSRYKPSWAERGVDKRAGQLHQEYVAKARKADQEHGGVARGEVGAVERKLASYPTVEGIVFGNWGEVSQATHQLVEELATSRARIADPQSRGRRGQTLTEEGIKSIAVGYIRRKLGIAAVKAQCHSLLGRLEGLGPGATTAAGRRRMAAEQERLWFRERQAHSISVRQGFSVHRRGFGKVD